MTNFIEKLQSLERIIESQKTLKVLTMLSGVSLAISAFVWAWEYSFLFAALAWVFAFYSFAVMERKYEDLKINQALPEGGKDE